MICVLFCLLGLLIALLTFALFTNLVVWLFIYVLIGACCLQIVLLFEFALVLIVCWVCVCLVDCFIWVVMSLFGFFGMLGVLFVFFVVLFPVVLCVWVVG